jgi:aminotransferase
MNKAIKKEVTDLQISTIRQFNELANTVDNVIKLTLGELDIPTPSIIKEQTIQALKDNKTKYTTNKGILPLRQEITQNTFYNQEECILTVGTTEALSIVLQTLLLEDDEVIIFTPGYVGYKPLINLQKAKVIEIDTTKYDITKETIESFITTKTKAILITNPNNPTGHVLDLNEMEAIKDCVLDHNLYLISDEIYQALAFEEIHSFQEYQDLKPQLIVLNGFSKSHAMTGFRIGYILASQELFDEFIKVHQYSVTSTSTLSQYAILGQTNSPIENIKSILKKRRDLVLETLDSLGIDYIYPKGAFYVFFNISHTNMTSFDYCEKLLYTKKVALIPGIGFLGNHDDYVRLSYAIDDTKLQEALDRIKAFEKAI